MRVWNSLLVVIAVLIPSSVSAESVYMLGEMRFAVNSATAPHWGYPTFFIGFGAQGDAGAASIVMSGPLTYRDSGKTFEIAMGSELGSLLTNGIDDNIVAVHGGIYDAGQNIVLGTVTRTESAVFAGLVEPLWQGGEVQSRMSVPPTAGIDYSGFRIDHVQLTLSWLTDHFDATRGYQQLQSEFTVRIMGSPLPGTTVPAGLEAFPTIPLPASVW